MRLSHSLGNLSSNSSGLLIKIVMCQAGNFADSPGKQAKININASLKLWIGSDSTLTNTSETLFDWLLPLLLIDAISH